MDAELKNKVKSDLDQFLKSKQYYHRLGRVWKRSYLLERKLTKGNWECRTSGEGEGEGEGEGPSFPLRTLSLEPSVLQLDYKKN